MTIGTRWALTTITIRPISRFPVASPKGRESLSSKGVMPTWKSSSAINGGSAISTCWWRERESNIRKRPAAWPNPPGIQDGKRKIAARRKSPCPGEQPPSGKRGMSSAGTGHRTQWTTSFSNWSSACCEPLGLAFHPRSDILEDFDIARWLDGLGLGEYAEAFRQNDIDAEALVQLTSSDLKELGVASLGHRKASAGGRSKSYVSAAATPPVPAVTRESEPSAAPLKEKVEIEPAVPEPPRAPVSEVTTAAAVASPEPDGASSVGREGSSRSSDVSKPPAPRAANCGGVDARTDDERRSPTLQARILARLFAGKFLLVVLSRTSSSVSARPTSSCSACRPNER